MARQESEPSTTRQRVVWGVHAAVRSNEVYCGFRAFIRIGLTTITHEQEALKVQVQARGLSSFV